MSRGTDLMTLIHVGRPMFLWIWVQDCLKEKVSYIVAHTLQSSLLSTVGVTDFFKFLP